MTQSALSLLRRPAFRRLYLSAAISQLGDSVHYIALMWFALEAGGPLGVVAVRLADSIPALIFGLHSGIVADRWDRKRTMIAADLIRTAVLVPVSILALAGRLTLWPLIIASFILETASTYFEPAYGAMLPALVDRDNAQRANGLVRATANAVGIGGWALTAALVALMPLGALFAFDAASFLASAAFLVGIRGDSHASDAKPQRVRLREGFLALRPLPALATAVVVLGIAVTISSGAWIGGVPDLVRSGLDLGAGTFSLVMVAFAMGSLGAGVLLTRFPVRDKARMSMLALFVHLPGYGLMAAATAPPTVFAGALLVGFGSSAAIVLINSAAQESIADDVLGRVMGLIALIDRGGHATGLLLVAPLFAILPPRGVFAAAALALPIAGLAGAAFARVASRSHQRDRGPLASSQPSQHINR
jgi:DHA3 family macrolide efflux protein-like MFS transporter